MSALFIEVPVTRRAPVTRIGVLARVMSTWRLERDDGVFSVDTDGATVAVRPPFDSAGFRSGLGKCVGTRLHLEGVPAAADGDIVYRVEPE